ncbi:MAG: hypothetical protein V2A69_14500 [Pseudomonadota bacterium]
MTPAGLYASSALLGGLGAWIIARIGGRLVLLDHPNERSSHKEPTPKGGGIGILAAFLFASIIIDVPIVFWAPSAFIALMGFLTAGSGVTLNCELKKR